MYRRIQVGKEGAQPLGCKAMCDSGLPDAKRWLKGIRKFEYFFTEYGWRKSGHAVLSEIRSKGVIAKVIAVKEKDPRIHVRYQDKWQVIVTWGKCENRKKVSRVAPR
jgi:hypothetical protein